jgi:hypothetical protein
MGNNTYHWVLNIEGQICTDTSLNLDDRLKAIVGRISDSKCWIYQRQLIAWYYKSEKWANKMASRIKEAKLEDVLSVTVTKQENI